MKAASQRLASIDIVRGAIMVLMAIDHVRVYAGVPAGGRTFGLFFTRWITNFSAPGFAFLAGTSAFLYLRSRGGDRRALSRFLLTRGAFLVLLELTLLRFAWTFNFDYSHYLLGGVIWMLGWCMILLAGLIWAPLGASVAFGALLVAGHDLLDPLLPRLAPVVEHSSAGWLWKILYFGGEIRGTPLIILYSIVPWIGVMVLGYAFGRIMTLDSVTRHRLCFRIGWAAVIAFVVLRGFDIYGDRNPWNRRPAAVQSAPPAPQPAAAPAPPRPRAPAWARFLGTSKYPASLLFLLMTLGPIILVLPTLESARGGVAEGLDVFGRVPLFFYILHIPLIHALAGVVSVIRDGTVNGWLFTNHPMANPPPPDGYTWSLPLLYLVWIAAIAILYPACRWYAALKARSDHPLLRYV